MILPSKHLDQNRALLTIGSHILSCLKQPKTVSALWELVSSRAAAAYEKPHSIRYEAFVLALDFLFLVGAIQIEEGLIRRTKP